MNTTSS